MLAEVQWKGYDILLVAVHTDNADVLTNQPCYGGPFTVYQIIMLYTLRNGKSGNSDILFSWTPKSLQMVTAAMKLRC